MPCGLAVPEKSLKRLKSYMKSFVKNLGRIGYIHRPGPDPSMTIPYGPVPDHKIWVYAAIQFFLSKYSVSHNVI